MGFGHTPPPPPIVNTHVRGVNIGGRGIILLGLGFKVFKDSRGYVWLYGVPLKNYWRYMGSYLGVCRAQSLRLLCNSLLNLLWQFVIRA